MSLVVFLNLSNATSVNFFFKKLVKRLQGNRFTSQNKILLPGITS